MILPISFKGKSKHSFSQLLMTNNNPCLSLFCGFYLWSLILSICGLISVSAMSPIFSFLLQSKRESVIRLILNLGWCRLEIINLSAETLLPTKVTFTGQDLNQFAGASVQYTTVSLIICYALSLALDVFHVLKCLILPDLLIFIAWELPHDLYPYLWM